MTLAVAAVGVAVLGGGAAIVAINAPEVAPPAPAPIAPEPHGPPEPAPTAVAQREAEDLRKLAKADCDAERWNDCVEKLDRASELDPGGNLDRLVQRMRLRATRAQAPQPHDPTSGAGRPPRELDATTRTAMTAALRGDGGSAGLRVQLACATAAEPSRFCDQLGSIMKKAGWVVARSALPVTAAALGSLRPRIEVAENADETTQAAADTLAQLLSDDGWGPRGPDDMMPTPGDPPLRVTLGSD